MHGEKVKEMVDSKSELSPHYSQWRVNRANNDKLRRDKHDNLTWGNSYESLRTEADREVG